MKIIKLSIGLLLFSPILFANPPEKSGSSVFTNRCGTCHKIDKDFVGPALAGIETRRNMDWIIKFVQSSQAMVKNGDKEAVALFNKYKVVMPDHPDLAEDDIKNIVDYISNETAAVKMNADPVKPPVTSNYLQIIKDKLGFIIAYSIVLLMLMGVLLFYAKVKRYERTKVW